VSFFDGENLTRWVGKKHLILPLVCFERMLYISWLVNASFRYTPSHHFASKIQRVSAYSRQSFERVSAVMFLFLRDRFLQASELQY
jgi:hypothetical protein